MSQHPPYHWHCLVKTADSDGAAVVNDMSFSDLERQVLAPMSKRQAFLIGGSLISGLDRVQRIQIVHTPQPLAYYASQYDNRMQVSGIADFSTDRRLLPFQRGKDWTHDLIQSCLGEAAERREPVDLIESVCRRLPLAAQLLTSRRAGKTPFEIADEYDVQDLLHATLKAYVPDVVAEDPLPKVAAAKSSRADLTLPELGVLIEVKFARGPQDQKAFFEQFSQDLLLYAQWPSLKTLIYLIYNAGALRDREAFERLAGEKRMTGNRRFDVRMVVV